MSAQSNDPNCIFCKIIAGQIPCHKVYEDDVVLAFLDIGPIVRGHTLVIPKFHCTNVLDASADLLAEVNKRLPQIAKAVLGATSTTACHILANCGSEASQSVQHLHYHILPRRVGDSYHLPWPSGKLDAAEAVSLKSAIATALAGKK